MKHRFFSLITLLVILALATSGCVGNNQSGNQPLPTKTPETTPQSTEILQPTETPQPIETLQPDQDVEDTQTQAPDEKTEAVAELKALLPDKEGYKWVYNGFAEYGHEVVLESIKEENQKSIYSTKGEVFDMSDGESEMDYSLSINFTVTSDSLIQNKNGEMTMDLFDSIELIQMPLQKDHTWTQTVKGKNGEEIVLESTIEKIEEQDGAKVYTVYYTNQNSSYFERRVIMEGVGVIGFTRLYITEPEYENYEVAYWLYEEASGYNK